MSYIVILMSFQTIYSINYDYISETVLEMEMQTHFIRLPFSPSRRREAPCEGTNSPRLFTPGETKALAKSKFINERGRRSLCVFRSLSCIITGGPAPILRSVIEVKPKKWRILTFAHAISMTTGP